jgi:hypothetical protein
MNLSVVTFLEAEIVPAAQGDAQKILTIEQIKKLLKKSLKKLL